MSICLSFSLSLSHPPLSLSLSFSFMPYLNLHLIYQPVMLSGSLKCTLDLVTPHYSQGHHPGQSKTTSPLDMVLPPVYTITFLLSITHGSQSDGVLSVKPKWDHIPPLLKYSSGFPCYPEYLAVFFAWSVIWLCLHPRPHRQPPSLFLVTSVPSTTSLFLDQIKHTPLPSPHLSCPVASFGYRLSCHIIKRPPLTAVGKIAPLSHHSSLYPFLSLLNRIYTAWQMTSYILDVCWF